MYRTVALIALSASLAGLTQPSEAFWPRSQLMACSEAIREAEYRRWRCWELDGYAGAAMPAFGGGHIDRISPPVQPYRRSPPRNIVSRLG